MSKDATAIYSDADLTIAFANEAMLGLWGRRADIVGSRFEDALPEMEGQPFIQLLKTAWQSGTLYEAQNAAAELLVDGVLQTAYFDFIYRPLIDDAGQTYALLHTATDVTAKVTGKEALEREQQQRELLENEQALNEELKSANEELYESRKALDELNDSLELQVKERTGAAEAERYRMEAMVMNTPFAMSILKGEDLIVEVANQPMLDIWRRNAGQVIGRGLVAIFPELKDQPNPGRMRGVLHSGKRFSLPETEVTLRTVDGTPKKHYARFSYDPIFEPDGSVNRILLTIVNITDEVLFRRQVQEAAAETAALNEELTATNEELLTANEQLYTIGRQLDESNSKLLHANTDLQLANATLQASETRALALFADAPVAIGLLTGPQFTVESANLELLRIWNKTGAVIGLPLREALPELAGQPFFALLEDVYATGEPFYGNEVKAAIIYDGRLKDRFFNFVYQAVKDDGGTTTAVMVVAHDVTEQVNARQAIEAAESNFRLIADNIAQFAWMASGKGHIFWYNKRWYDYTGATPEEMNSRGWQKIHHPEHMERVAEKLSRHYRSGEAWEDTFPLRRHDGEYRWFLSRAVPTKDAAGTVISWFGTHTDITEQRRMEEQKDDFISVASHELKTPLTSLRATLQLLERMKDELQTPMAPKLIMSANKSMAKINTLIDDLLNVNRFSEGRLTLQKSRFNVAQMLEQCCSHIRLEQKYTLVIEGDRSVETFADEQRVDQVVVNFVNNAIKYAPASKTIRLVIDKLPEAVKIAVSDSGAGIPAEQLPHLFDRYWRASHSGKQYSGLGLGLFICAEIVHRHGGEIGADSILGEGATFWFTIPDQL